MSRRRTFVFLVGSISLASGLWLACGGSDQTNSLPPTPDSGTTTDSGLDGGSADGAVTDSGGDTGTVVPEAGGGDGGINPPDAGPGGGTTIITCGATSCAIPAESCCVDRLGGGQTAFGCFAGTCPGVDAGTDTASLKCSGQANCAAGTVCCVSSTGGNSATSECKATCGANQAQLCDPNATPTGCPAGDAGTCSNSNIGDWSLPQTYATCGGVGN